MTGTGTLKFSCHQVHILESIKGMNYWKRFISTSDIHFLWAVLFQSNVNEQNICLRTHGRQG